MSLHLDYSTRRLDLANILKRDAGTWSVEDVATLTKHLKPQQIANRLEVAAWLICEHLQDMGLGLSIASDIASIEVGGLHNV